jgi:hypothetical protein
MLHFFLPWTGIRYVLVYATGEGVRGYWVARAVDKSEIPTTPTRAEEKDLLEQRMRVQAKLMKAFNFGPHEERKSNVHSR